MINKFCTKLYVSLFLLTASNGAFAACQKISDLNTFFDWIECNAQQAGNTARIVAALVGLIFIVGGVIGWKVASGTNDPTKTKGAAATSVVVGLILVGLIAWVSIFGNVTTENKNVIESWDTEWSSGSGSGGGGTSP